MLSFHVHFRYITHAIYHNSSFLTRGSILWWLFLLVWPSFQIKCTLNKQPYDSNLKLQVNYLFNNKLNGIFHKCVFNRLCWQLIGRCTDYWWIWKTLIEMYLFFHCDLMLHTSLIWTYIAVKLILLPISVH